MKVTVKEISFSWTGTKLWEEKGFGADVWYVIRPDEYSVHTRRGSGNREYAEDLIRVPNFMNQVSNIPSV